MTALADIYIYIYADGALLFRTLTYTRGTSLLPAEGVTGVELLTINLVMRHS